MNTTIETTNPQPSAVRQARVTVPLLLGGAVAAWVAQTAFLNPGADYRPANLIGTLIPIAVAAFAAVLARRVGLLNARGASAVILGLTAFAALLFSVGLGLTSFHLNWVVAPLALFGFAATAGCTALVLRSTR